MLIIKKIINKSLFLVFLLSILCIFDFNAKIALAESYACVCANNKSTTAKTSAECETFCTGQSSTVARLTVIAPTDSTACTSGSCTLTNPLGTSISTPEAFIGKVINAVLGIVGAVALLMFIYGGFIWLTAAGNSERVKKGQQVIIWAAIGLAVIFMSYALVSFLIVNLSA